MIGIILINGKLNSDKLTVTNTMLNYFWDNHWTAIVESLESPIRYLALKEFGWDGDEETRRGRRLVQNISNTGREYNKDLWVEKLYNKILLLPDLDYVIIDDWKFPSEYEYLKSCDNFIIKTVGIISHQNEILDTDVSETSLDNHEYYDFIINNNAGLDELETATMEIASEIIRSTRDMIEVGEC